jgi:hypothetical protein
LKTSEEVYIYFKQEAYDDLSCVSNIKNIDRSLDILLAEEDYEKFKNFEDKLELNINSCNNLKSQLNGKVKFIPVVPFSYWGVGVRKDLQN